MSGFGNFRRFDIGFVVERQSDSSCHAHISVVLFCPRFSQGFTSYREIKLVHRSSGLLELQSENPRNCTVARYYRARKNGISRFRHRDSFRFALFPYRSATFVLNFCVSIFPRHKSIIGAQRFHNCILWERRSRRCRHEIYFQVAQNDILTRKAQSALSCRNKFTLEFGLKCPQLQVCFKRIYSGLWARLCVSVCPCECVWTNKHAFK